VVHYSFYNRLKGLTPMIDRTDWKFLGITIGTTTGWDGEMEEFVLYDFIAAPGINLPNGDLNINIPDGKFVYYDNEGNENISFDIIDTLKGDLR
jgi:hypothetical protein